MHILNPESNYSAYTHLYWMKKEEFSSKENPKAKKQWSDTEGHRQHSRRRMSEKGVEEGSQGRLWYLWEKCKSVLFRLCCLLWYRLEGLFAISCTLCFTSNRQSGNSKTQLFNGGTCWPQWSRAVVPCNGLCSTDCRWTPQIYCRSRCPWCIVLSVVGPQKDVVPAGMQLCSALSFAEKNYTCGLVHVVPEC